MCFTYTCSFQFFFKLVRACEMNPHKIKSSMAFQNMHAVVLELQLLLVSAVRQTIRHGTFLAQKR